jgi:hypothetical protein
MQAMQHLGFFQRLFAEAHVGRVVLDHQNVDEAGGEIDAHDTPHLRTGYRRQQ